MKRPSLMVSEHKRVGDILGARIGVKIENHEGVKAFMFKDKIIAYTIDDQAIHIEGGALPLLAARALGHFLVNESRSR